ncbi:hypothetical protein EXIGLDRAFT_646361 [Exidia glandulosa HHB12029]|uniref:Uncharacterized protein n=1 Tax=Exidia glandulosa HHB12029 TaxID=1314781 RepID=A0A165IF87_EXIGL|nr:hypothetical protein EXIGLDRAFT_646361 [Exidia glandulosa HHB12029]
MAPSEYYIRLQRGIRGGFAPPRPSEVVQITHSSASPETVLVAVETRADGSAGLTAAAPKSVAATKASTLVEELQSLLKDLPVETPRGTADIYGLDIGITFGSSELEWANGSGAGCGPGQSEVQATEEQKAKFKRAVEIVEQLVAQEA